MKTGSKDVTQGRHGLRYIGDGAGVPGVGARDLNEAEISGLAVDQSTDVRELIATLISTGLYMPGAVAALKQAEEVNDAGNT